MEEWKNRNASLDSNNSICAEALCKGETSVNITTEEEGDTIP